MHIPIKASAQNNPPAFKPPEELCGEIDFERLGRGLMMRSTRWEVLRDLRCENVSFKPSLRLVFLLSGKDHLKFGNRSLDICADKKPAGLWLPIGKHITGEKLFRKGEKQDEFILFFSDERLSSIVEDMACLPDWYGSAPDQHLICRPFEITPHMAHQIANCRELAGTCPLIARLQRELIALDLFQSVCLQLFIESEKTAPIKSDAVRHVDTLTALMHSGKADNMTLQEMARVCGTNVTSLQRHFQQVHGLSIWQYLRKLKLERAHRAIMMGKTVGEAAEIAGYQHIESFAKAFKQCFNCTPKQVKQRSAD